MKLSHHAVATAQVGLSYLIFVGYFGVVVGEGMKLVTPGTASSLKDIIALCAAFWFMRQRESTPPPNPPTETKTP